MPRNIICPDCGNENLICDASITATLRTIRRDDGTMDYELTEWDDVKQINSYDCPKCGFGFIGDEDEFLEETELKANEAG